MANTNRRWPTVLTTAVAALQGFALISYAIAIVIVALIAGLDSHEEVSTPTGLVVQVVAFILLGAGLLGLALGRWQCRPWSATPFAMAQILGLAVGVPLLLAPDGTGSVVGLLVSLSAVAGLVGLVATALVVVDVTEQPELSEDAAVGARSEGRLIGD
ncbi:MAG: hypothetical protein KDC39_02110 [Actinobacteria bacterium]|nr:hypothetical protein [Actinomycetota bacterium]